MLKNNKLWKEFVYICLLFVQDENQEILMQQKRLYIYIYIYIYVIIIIIIILYLKIVTSPLSEALL